MREIRTSGLMRGKEVGGHCLCALIPWLPSLLYSSPGAHRDAATGGRALPNPRRQIRFLKLNA